MTPRPDELTARESYLEAIRLNGPEHMLRKTGRGWRGWFVRTWDGSENWFGRKCDAIAQVQAMAKSCAKRVNELRARLVAADFDAEMAATSPEDRLASAKAQRAAYHPTPGYRRSA